MKKAYIGDTIYEVDEKSGEIFINGNPIDFDVVRSQSSDYHVLSDSKSYNSQIVNVDRDNKIVDLKINGNSYTVQIKDDLDMLLEKLGMEANSASGAKEVKAPMPGLILDVLVENGKEVKKGDHLVILEAMKMENVIKSPIDGVVNDLKAVKGESVEKGKILLSL